MAELTRKPEIRDAVRERYAAAAQAAAHGAAPGCDTAGSCCEVPVSTADRHGREVFGAALYDESAQQAGGAALRASLGCGNPTAVAELRDGDVVLDLGSGAGGDVLLSARRVAPRGRAIGLDMTDEMLELARRNAADANVENVEFVRGEIERIPLPDGSVDAVISNCVINLSGDKPQVLREASRVLKPGGRFAVSDVIADEDMNAQVRADMAQWTGCIAGALTRAEFERALAEAGLTDIEVAETHRVHEHAGSAIIRARKPGATGCCSTALDACCEPEAKPDCCGEPGAASGTAPPRCGCRG